MKICFVKESSYQDLWVGFGRECKASLVANTHMRIGPVGLLDIFDTDFYVLKPNWSKAARLIRKYQISELSEQDYLDISLRRGFYGLSSQTNRRPCDYEIDPFSISWDKYDACISVNYAVPLEIRKQYNSVCWICMPGEGVIPRDATGWDFWISHNTPRSPLLKSNIIDIPYTFLTSKSLEDFCQERKDCKSIYVEINSLSPSLRGNWLENLPSAQRLLRAGFKVNFHPNMTLKHLKMLDINRYFVKLGGRSIRGNSLFEAISAGLVCLIKPTDCFGDLTLPSFCYFTSDDQLCAKLNRLEGEPGLRKRIIDQQFLLLGNVSYCVKSQISQAVHAKRHLARNLGRNIEAKTQMPQIIGFVKWWGHRVSMRYFNDMQATGLSCPPLYEL